GGAVGGPYEARRGQIADVDTDAKARGRPGAPEPAAGAAVEIQGGVAAQQIEAFPGAEVQHQAPRCEPHRAVGPAPAGRLGPHVEPVALDPQPVGDPEAEPAAAADLVVQQESPAEPGV